MIELLPVVAGIYCIRNAVTGETYVGQSANMASRQMGHLASLLRGNHDSVSLQTAFAKHGRDVFRFEVLEEAPGATRMELLVLERRWAAQIKPAYTMKGQPSRCPQLPPSEIALAPPPERDPLAHVAIMRARTWDYEAALAP